MNVNTSPIAILLSTYNSEKYLCEQIDSILRQSNKNWELYIRDDSSTDSTLSIISDYCSKFTNIRMLTLDKKNVGVKNSFFELLKNVDSQYYMFCDHDDVWLPDKIEKSYRKMKEEEEKNIDTAIVVCSDLVVVDHKLQIIHDSMWKYSRFFPEILKSSFKYLSVCNFVTGCTMMINSKAKDLSLPVSSHATLHDNWIALKVLSSNGIISPIYDATILYRQHGKNICGASEFKKTRYLSNKIKTLPTVFRNNKAAYEMAKSAGKINVFVFIGYKILYYIKRRLHASNK